MNSLRPILVAVLAIFLIFLLSVSYSSALHLGKSGILSADYGKFYQSARFILEGKDAYTPIFYFKQPELGSKEKATIRILPGNLNAPIFNLLILPLGYFSYATSLLLWSALSVVGGFISIFLLHRKIFSHEAAAVNLTVGLALAFFIYYPTFATIQFGQITLVLLPLVVGAWLAAQDGRSWLAAILLGIAASIKPFFGLFLIYFLIRREWRALFLFVGVILMGLLVPLILLGKQTFLNYFAILHGIKWSASNWNASILGVLIRLFGVKHELNTALIPIAGLTNKLYLPLCALFLLLLLKFLWPKSGIKLAQKCGLDFSVTLVMMLLLSPLGWVYYFPFLIVPLMTLWQFTKNNYYPSSFPILMTLIVILSGLPQDLIASSFIKPENVAPVFFWSCTYPAALLLLLGTFFFLRTALPKQDCQKIHAVLPNYLLVLLAVVALLPSFIGIVHTAHNIKIYGHHFVQQYRFAYFGK